MRESIGGTWIFSLVIVFIVLFTGYLAVSVNYSRAFKVKNGIINIIEENEGHSSNAEEEITSYLNGSGYFVFGSCASNETGYGRQSSQSNKFRYCVSKVPNNETTIPSTRYYVRVFFRLDLPVFGDLLTFPITGEIKAVYFANDNVN